MNIITIDFDIIMSPSIELYNDLIGDDYTTEDFIEQYPFLKDNLPADFYIYDYLTRFIIKCTKKTKNIFFIDDHSEICNIITSYPTEAHNLINIDHHHDVGYNIDLKRPLKDLDCGNWVKWLKDKKYINSYVWIRDEKADIEGLDDNDHKKYINEIKTLDEAQLEYLSKSIDCLVICASWEWIPSNYNGLYINWKTICEEMAE